MAKPDEGWEPHTSQDWFEQVEAWPWRRDGAEWVKHGPCPRCEHPMSKRVGGGALPLDDAAEVNVWCNCLEDHEGRPEDRKGCGQNARITGPPDA